LTETNASTVVALCHRLDGLPLAIELAAARVALFSPQALLRRMDQRLPLLVGGPRDQPDRLRSMRHAIAWSHDLLTPDEQVLFRRLSVFVGGFTLGAAERVTGDGSPLTLDVVASLLDKSLLQQGDGHDDEPRFAMLETIREFGLEQLDECGEADAIRDRHTGWCQDLVDSAWTSWLQRSDIDRNVHRLELEHDNLRAALHDLNQRDAVDGILRLASGLCWFWLTRGYVREGLAWLASALERCDHVATHFRTRALIGAGALAHYLGDEAQAGPFLRQGLADARTLDDALLVAHALISLGIDEADEGRFDRAIPLFDEAISITRAVGDRIGLAQALSYRGLFGWASGEAEAAEALVREALTVQRAAQDAWGVGHSLAFLGLFACERGDGAGAATYVAESLTNRLAVGAWRYLPWALENVALFAWTTGRPVAASRLFGAAANLSERIGSPGHEPERSAYMRAIERVRAALGESAFEAAWAAGQALPLEEIVAEAMLVAPAPCTAPAASSGSASPHGLSPRERDVLRLLVEGASDQEIATRLYISRRTASNHVHAIFTKLGVGSRAAAVALAVRRGLG
jgi:non-specific serine/threonine protein kinase